MSSFNFGSIPWEIRPVVFSNVGKGLNPRLVRAQELKAKLEQDYPELGEFYLYGSTSKIVRDIWGTSVGSFDKNSDYDFAIQLTPASEDAIKGFAQNTTNYAYADASTKGVYECEVDGEKVQISLRYKLNLFKELWESIPVDFYWQYINKRSPTVMPKMMIKDYFDQLYKLVENRTYSLKDYL